MSESTERLAFELKLDGYEQRGNIHIGAEAQKPPKGRFALSARAEEANSGRGEGGRG